MSTRLVNLVADAPPPAAAGRGGAAARGGAVAHEAPGWGESHTRSGGATVPDLRIPAA